MDLQRTKVYYVQRSVPYKEWKQQYYEHVLIKKFHLKKIIEKELVELYLVFNICL